MPIQVEGRAEGRKKGGRLGLLVGCGGFTESGAPHSSLSFLNGLFVGKAVASARPGVKLQKPSGRVEQLHASFRRVANMELHPKRRAPLPCI